MGFAEPTIKVRRDFRSLAVVFVSALILRALYLYAMSTQFDEGQICQLVPDSSKYIRVAQYMIESDTTAETELFLVGPGFPLFLVPFLKIFGVNGWPILFIQIILSSLSCSLIYLFALILLEDRTAALTAGLLSAIYLTSISLSAVLLTETLFIFLFLLSLNLFFRGLIVGNRRDFIWSGIAGGVSILVRSVSQFFWILFMVFAIVYSRKRIHAWNGPLIWPMITAAIMLLFIAGWGFRNYAKHQVFTIAETGLGAARVYLVPRVICDSKPGQDLFKVKDEIDKPRSIGEQSQTIKDRHDESIQIIRSAFIESPSQFLITYFDIVWENVTSGSLIHPKQLPQFQSVLRYYEKFTSGGNNSSFVVILSGVGLFILIVQRKFAPAMVFLSILLYFGLLTGVTYWQGSRVFFPAQAAWPILAGVVFSRLRDWIVMTVRLTRTRLNKKPAGSGL